MHKHQLTSLAESFLQKKQHGHYINNQWRSPEGEDRIEIVNPANARILTSVGVATGQEVHRAVSSARAAFNDPSWRRISPSERESLMLELARLIDERHESIAEVLTIENGKLFDQARSEVRSAAATFRYYAGWCTKMEGEIIDVSMRQAPGKQNFSFTKREPIGVVAAIVPWNFPISIASWKLAPLLAAGCTAVLKPSEVTPLSSLLMAELFDEAGFPPGVVNVITGDGRTGAALTSHPGIDKITFTGSTEVGKLIGKAAMENLTEISLELGGKSPAIVFADADLKAASKGVAMGIFRNGGQVCVAGSRAYVEESVFDEFLGMIKKEAEKLKISDGFDPEAQLGPLVSDKHLQRVCQYVDLGKQHARLEYGGKRSGTEGYYLEPTIFSATENSGAIVSEEIFGPVLVVIPFRNVDEVIEKANDTPYGLSSAVWTADISKAMRCVDELQAGWVFVNSIPRSDPNFPIGGYKQSGIGKELGKTGLYNYTKIKSVNIVY